MEGSTFAVVGARIFILSLVAVAAGCSALTSFANFVGESDATEWDASPEAGENEHDADEREANPPRGSDGATASDGSGAEAASDAADASPDAVVDAGVDATPCIVTTGPMFGTDFSAIGGSAPWSNPSNVATTDGTAATTSLDAEDSESNTLVVTGFGIAVPQTATIVGVKATTVRRASSTAVRDGEVRLRYNGDSISSNRAQSSPWTNIYTTATRGNSSDVWGASLTPTVVNHGTFGIELNVTSVTPATAYLDSISLEIAYDTCL